MHAFVWFDGACAGNPGPMGGGAVVRLGDHEETVSVPLGLGTNNEAEYQGLIAGLRRAAELGAQTVTVRGDSQLVLRQLEGRYRVKAPNLHPLYDEARGLLGRFREHRIEWVPRDQNAEADAAARAALDRR